MVTEDGDGGSLYWQTHSPSQLASSGGHQAVSLQSAFSK